LEFATILQQALFACHELRLRVWMLRYIRGSRSLYRAAVILEHDQILDFGSEKVRHTSAVWFLMVRSRCSGECADGGVPGNAALFQFDFVL